jgi:hypothetical protein
MTDGDALQRQLETPLEQCVFQGHQGLSAR